MREFAEYRNTLTTWATFLARVPCVHTLASIDWVPDDMIAIMLTAQLAGWLAHHRCISGRMDILAAGRPAHHRCISGRMGMDMDYGARFAPAAAQPDRGDSEPACEIRDTGAKGMGVFAEEDIERGRWVCQYIGTLVSDSDESETNAESRELPWDPLGLMPTPESTSGLPRVDSGSDYVLALCPGLCLDARHSNHFSRYINHDEHGNLQCSVSVDERRADFFAAAPIRRGSSLNTHARAPWEPP